MGRLENFVPQLKKHSFKKDARSYLLFEEGQVVNIPEGLNSFVKHMNGHLSLQEIFLFLNSKNESPRISACLKFVDELAKRNLILHVDDYRQLKGHADPSLENFTKGFSYEKSYFSNERLIGIVQKTTLFLQCHRKTAEGILKHSQVFEFKKGEKLIQMGTKSPHFYVLLSGTVGVYRDAECLALLHPLSVFGESAAVFNKARNADVIALESSFALKIDASKIVDTHDPQSFDSFKGLKSRLILNQTLSANPLFSDIPTDALQLFISQCRVEKYSKEQTIITQGDTSGDFYFILQGSVAIIKDGLPVTSLAEGDHFGEVAALFRQPRTASVLTETSATFLVLNQQALFEVLCCHFKLAQAIEKIADERRLSTKTVFEIFEDTASIKKKEFTQSGLTMPGLEIDEDFVEISHSNFDLEVHDFSENSENDDLAS